MSAISIVNHSAPRHAIQGHTQFWDRRKKGYITPMDSVAGFMNLGYGILFSVTIGTFLGVVFSYASQDSWLPDPRCRVDINRLIQHTQKKPNANGIYDADGNFEAENFERLFAKYARTDISGNTITFKELLQMTNENMNLGKDPTAWTNAILEWCTAYFFIGQKGVLRKEDVRAAYDGSLFYRLSNTGRPAIENTGNNKKKKIPLIESGIKIPQKTLVSLEDHINGFLQKLPRSYTSFILEQVQHIRSLSLSAPMALQPHLTGVSKQTTDSVANDSPVTLFAGGLTGVKSIHFTSENLPLTGIKGSIKQESDIEEENDEGQYYYSPEMEDMEERGGSSPTSLVGIVPEGGNYYREEPVKDLLNVGTLTGVRHDDFNTASGSGSSSSYDGYRAAEQEEEEQYSRDTKRGLTGVQYDDLQNYPDLPGLANNDDSNGDNDNQSSYSDSSRDSPMSLPNAGPQHEEEHSPIHMSTPIMDTSEKFQASQENHIAESDAQWPILPGVLENED
ncbi:Caleosin related protein-domain-containing protein [Radiomyces spectabilis]|uniref:Caleosin related protein-domain-containing protein n=1 Tax=Radiomyces spectabilis TaxID=64574 RepID=UPI00221EA06B|nr:Caleosin related protein-domain-containing protein [Radiomyces spectabilis]KAI8394235.1 Caleosin related protein-domain-containing protein [Radiomyces spectabilis]